MGTYGLDGVILAWRQGALTTEQAVGQMLQIMQQMEERLREVERGLNTPKPPATPLAHKRRNKSDDF